MHDGASLYDKFGPGFTLLVRAGVDIGECRPLVAAAHKAAVPLSLLQRDEPALAQLYPTRFTLIRPDQHVAWRGDAIGDNAAGIIARVSGAAP